ncbi:hypothetical protein HK096_004134 [Nowakowskiella sp. JEL0078]|nr:hypothetical protein HK096_004134 [Nowakowskiella sp. JEL0078]
MHNEMAVRDLVVSKIRMGDFQSKSGKPAEALQSFSEAEMYLDNAMNRSEIVKLEEKIEEALSTPVKKNLTKPTLPNLQPKRKVLEKPAGLTRTKSTSIKKLDLQPKSQEENKIDQLPKGTAQFECHVLSDIKAEVVSKIGASLTMQDKLEEGEKRLVDGQDFLQRGVEQADFYSNLASVKLRKLTKSLHGTRVYEMFGDTAVVFSWSLPKVGTLSSKSRVNTLSLTSKPQQAPQFQKSVFHVEELLEEAIRHISKYGTSARFQDACHKLVYAKMLRVFLGGIGENNISNDLAWLSAFFLEIPKGLTARREMQAIKKALINSTWPEIFDVHSADQSPGLLDQSNTENSDDEDESLPSINHLLKPLEKFQDFIKSIPTNWTVCSLSVDTEKDDLYLTRFTSVSVPIVLRLPLKRQLERDGQDGASLSFAGVMQRLKNILKESVETMDAVGKGESIKEFSNDQKADWWKKRRGLDTRLKDIVEIVDTKWLGAFKGLLLPENKKQADDSIVQQFKKALESLLMKLVRTKKKIVPRKLNKSASNPVISDSASKSTESLTLDDQFIRSILRGGSVLSYDELEDLVHYMVDAMQASGHTIDLDEINFDGLVEDCYTIVKKFASPRPNEYKKSDNRLILVLDRHLHSIPWESIPSLRNIPISRLPSMEFLQDRLKRCLGNHDYLSAVAAKVSKKNVGYVLNPAGDLIRTQSSFEGFLKSEKSWNGKIAVPPQENEFAEMLKSNDIFLYFGHGGGESYIKGHTIRKLEKCAVTLLMGCSSGLLNSCGEFDAIGTPLHYLIAGSYAVVANLWDVTDKDIDKFTKTVFEHWGIVESEIPEENKGDLVEAVMLSRSSCTLGYLNGAAPVVYGIPVELLERI